MGRLVFLLLFIIGTASAQALQVGVAEVDITPPVGAPLAGYYTNREGHRNARSATCQAMVIEQGGTKVAIVACDLVSPPRDIDLAARAMVEQKIGPAGDHIMISATHDHTTPVILTNPSRYNLEGEPKRIAAAYTKALPGKIAQAILLANAAMVPAQMRATVGGEDTLGFNRRYFMKDGTVGWNPGKLNPNIARPAGPVDRAAPVLYFESPDDTKPLAAYVNFGVHQDTNGDLEFSEDYPYTVSRILKMAKGDDFFTLFTIGATGNVNHIDVSRKGPQMGYEEAARIGAVLAGQVLKIGASTADIRASPIIRAAIATVRDVRGTLAPDGSRRARPNCCPSLTATWSSRFPTNSPSCTRQQAHHLRPALSNQR